jgi:hypothetical protein
MIFEALEFIRRNLNDYIVGTGKSPGGDPEPVMLGNIGAFDQLDDSSTDMVDESSRLIISLVNMQEEFAFKNAPAVRQSETRPLYANPPVYMNLYVLVSANHKNYQNALMMLSLAVAYFQSRQGFTFSDAPLSVAALNMEEDSLDALRFKRNFKMNLDLHSMTFEQLNHLWGTLGGKQVPSALYKARVVEIDKSMLKEGGGYITEIETKHS